MLKSTILSKKNVHLLYKQAKCKKVFIFIKSFCHEGEGGSFIYIYIAYIFVYYSIEYTSQGTARCNSHVWDKRLTLILVAI
jgi:hypothetical protein